MKNVIRQNDPTSHGGAVTGASATEFVVDGLPVARKGDPVSCPLPGHSGCVIVEGNPEFLVDGVPVAFHGHKTSCGAELISTLSNFSSD